MMFGLGDDDTVDEDARYLDRRTIYLSAIEPLVALPDEVVNNSVPISSRPACICAPGSDGADHSTRSLADRSRPQLPSTEIQLGKRGRLERLDQGLDEIVLHGGAR